MALTINTNLSSMIVQKNLNSATTSLNNAIERMTTGYKINHAKDNAAGYSIAKSWETKLGSLDVASENASMGADLLQTAEENYSLITEHLQRVRDLTEQAANGTYGADSLEAIKSEMTARLAEIDRIAANAEFNGIALFNGAGKAINLQVGIDGTAAKSQITLEANLFSAADSKTLLDDGEITAFVNAAGATATAAGKLTKIDAAINKISARVTSIGSAQNRVESAISSIAVQSENLTSSLSTIKDADVASESSSYIKAQILQQASATLLATANQAPSIALNLI